MNATGGSAPFSVTDPATGEVRAVNWVAPALNTVLYRFTPEEVAYIITYGRPGTPMSAWGLDGGGPLNAQQVAEPDRLHPVDPDPREDCDGTEVDDPNCPTGHLPTENQEQIEQAARDAVESGEYASYGEALFNLGLSSGAYSCARCHTSGWSYGDPQESGQGGLGPNITGGVESAHFPNDDELIDFISQRQRERRGLRRTGPGQRQDAGVRCDAHRRSARRHRRLRAEPVDVRRRDRRHHLGSPNSAASSSRSSASPC